MSLQAYNTLKSLPHDFMASLSAAERLIVLNTFLYLVVASKGRKISWELQIRAALAICSGKDLLAQSGTGSGKTLAMIISALLFSNDTIVITVSPLRLIQDNLVLHIYLSSISMYS
ncbi:hypothetical protein B0H10DRAFT_1859906 [Mycena sp. CBHHK59/15]|nr:hypothetical protein B0H10DRAFT_1859906 [Mycena sp. CBHHK59/15]